MSKKNPWKKTASKIVYKNPWIRVREDAVIRPDGTPGIYGVVEMPGASAIAAVNTAEEIYLIKQYRYPLKCYTIELPWGGREKRETFLQTAQRELREEAGVSAKYWKFLGKVTDMPGISDEFVHLYLARKLTMGRRIVPSEEGTQEVILLPLDKVYSWALNGKIEDAVTVTGIVRAYKYIKKN